MIDKLPERLPESLTMWRVICVILFSILGFLCSWGFTSIETLNRECVRHAELQCMQDRLDNQFRRLSDKVDDINRYLRDR